MTSILAITPLDNHTNIPISAVNIKPKAPIINLASIGSIFIVKNTILYGTNSVISVKDGSYFIIKANLKVPDDQIIRLPLLSNISDRTKIDIGYGVQLDCWSVKNYNCEIKIIEDIATLPLGTKIILNGVCEKKILNNGLIVYRLYTAKDSLVEYIECSSYIENYVGIFGDIGHVTEKIFTTMTIKEFDRVMVVADSLKLYN